jgi:hypothetical protein
MKGILLATLSIFLLASTASAGKYDITIPADLGNATFASFVREAGTATAYRALAPAAPQGITGFDIGIALSTVNIQDANWEPLFRDQDAPSLLPVPKIQARKGLPFNLDVGAFYAEVPNSNMKLWGGEVQWAALEGGIATPALAVRGSYSSLSGVTDLDLETYGVDAVISKGFPLFTPYGGIGLIRVVGDYTGTATDALTRHTFNEVRYFGGVQLSLMLLRITAEAEYMDRPVYSLKASVGW